MAEKHKIAVVLPYFGPGGAEKMVAQLVSGLDRTQFEPKVFCSYAISLCSDFHAVYQVECNGTGFTYHRMVNRNVP